MNFRRGFNSILGRLIPIIRGGVYVSRVFADKEMEPVVNKFRHVQPKLYVGPNTTAIEVAKFARSRQHVPVDILQAEVRNFFH